MQAAGTDSALCQRDSCHSRPWGRRCPVDYPCPGWQWWTGRSEPRLLLRVCSPAGPDSFEASLTRAEHQLCWCTLMAICCRTCTLHFADKLPLNKGAQLLFMQTNATNGTNIMSELWQSEDARRQPYPRYEPWPARSATPAVLHLGTACWNPAMGPAINRAGETPLAAYATAPVFPANYSSGPSLVPTCNNRASSYHLPSRSAFDISFNSLLVWSLRLRNHLERKTG